jgi:hypothetical protein
VAEEGQPRRPATTGNWPVMVSKDTSHDIFINVSTKGSIYLLRDPWTAEPWVALL